MAARFKREARLVSKLSDPHTVQVFDYGVSDGVTWMVMQLVSGSDLSRLLRKQGVFEAARVAQVVDGVCRSLSEAHSLGIVHRDIEPGNIMLTEADEAVVLDFGLAKLRDSRESNQLSAPGDRDWHAGLHVSRQSSHGLGGQLDARADIYSLGAVMYRMLVGRAPFRGGTAAEMCLRQLQERPLSPHLARGVPIPLSDAVMRALEPEPDRRYQSAEALRRAVLAAAYQTTTTSCSP